MRAAVEQPFHEANQAGVLDLNTGYSALAGGDRESPSLKERKINVGVEEFRF